MSEPELLLTNSQGIPSEEWEEQQEVIERWVLELGERLKVDKNAIGKALHDWVYINTDTDWLEVAARDNSNEHQSWPRPPEGYGAELREFMAEAASAWYKAWSETPLDRPRLRADDVLEAIRNLISDFEDQ